MNSIQSIPVEWLQQIYIKKGKQIKFADKYNRSNIEKLCKDYPGAPRLIIFYCIAMMKYREDDIIGTITISLDFDDEFCRNMIIGNKMKFYQAIRILVELKILYKLKPKVYIVSMDYICLMSLTQKSYFHSHVYSRRNPMNITRLPTEPRTPHVE